MEKQTFPFLSLEVGNNLRLCELTKYKTMIPALPTFPEVNAEKSAIEGVGIKHLAEEFGSPLFIFSERIIKQKIFELQNALEKYYPNSQIAYSINANRVPAIIKIFKEKKIWAEVGSGFEYWLAKKLYFPDTEIIFNGTDKGGSALFAALENGASIHADNLQELESIGKFTIQTRRRVSVGLRINVHVGLHYGGKLGFELSAGEAYNTVKLLNKKFPLVKVCGLHVHLGPFVKDTKFYALAAEQLSDFALELKKDFGLNITYLDLGGGMSAPGARPFDQEIWVVPEISEYMKEIADVLNKKFPDKKPKLYIEPGKYLVDESGVLLTTVTDVKMTTLRPERTKRGVFLKLRNDAKDDKAGFQLANVNASAISMLPTAQLRHHRVDVISNHHSADNKRIKTIVGGNSCMPNDFLCWDVAMPKLFSGDHLLFYNAGAYELSRSEQFIHPRPAVVMLYANGSVKCVRRRETFEYIVALDEF
ncbi:MAG: hypothetical protein Q7S86_02660 [bacterium]|nr:hypothetical protein [bacterium]